MAEDIELKWIRQVIFVHGVAGGSEQLRLGLYSRSDLTGLVINSDWAEVADWVSEIGNANGDYQIGFMRFDFERQHLDSDTEYHLAIETNNYTRNADTFYLAAISDWPDPVNTPATNPAYYAGAAHWFGYADRSKPA
jgi:hypothetical protein